MARRLKLSRCFSRERKTSIPDVWRRQGANTATPILTQAVSLLSSRRPCFYFFPLFRCLPLISDSTFLTCNLHPGHSALPFLIASVASSSSGNRVRGCRRAPCPLACSAPRLHFAGESVFAYTRSEIWMMFLSMGYSTSVEYVFVCVRRGGVLPTKHNRPTFHRAGFCMEMNVQGAFIFRVKVLSSKGYFIP